MSSSDELYPANLLGLVLDARAIFEKKFDHWVTEFLLSGGINVGDNCAFNFAGLEVDSRIPALEVQKYLVKTLPGLGKTWTRISEEVRVKSEEASAFISSRLLNNSPELRIKVDRLVKEQYQEAVKNVLVALVSNVKNLVRRRIDRVEKYDTSSDYCTMQARRLIDQISIIRLDPFLRGCSYFDENGNVCRSTSNVPPHLVLMSLGKIKKHAEKIASLGASKLAAKHKQQLIGCVVLFLFCLALLLDHSGFATQSCVSYVVSLVAYLVLLVIGIVGTVRGLYLCCP